MLGKLVEKYTTSEPKMYANEIFVPGARKVKKRKENVHNRHKFGSFLPFRSAFDAFHL
jgi:hypothetical protein